MTDPTGFIRALVAEEYADVMERYQAPLFKALPDVPRAEIIWRFQFMLCATSYAIIGTEVSLLCIGWNLDDPAQAPDRERPLLPLMGILPGGLPVPLAPAPAACNPPA